MLELTGSGAEPLEPGDPHRIGSIPLAGRLGAGGMGRVYLGVREGRYVAVKQLLSSVVGEDQDFLRRFGHELDNLARLPADATAPLLDSDRTATPPWFATAYIPGLTLREAVALHGGPLPAEALWLLLREAAAGLAAVHALDMVHRDLKPSNVMLTLDGLTLIDFGVARAAEQSQLTRTGMVVGTPAYMAPEQASGRRRLSGATDVFALGSVLAYAACGRPPFGDESGHGVLYRIVHEEPDLAPLRELEPDLAELVAACLDKDPEGRPTAAELLERAAGHGPFAAPLWPGAVAERLAERAAFAADVREADVPTVPLTGERAEPEPRPEPGTGKTPEDPGPSAPAAPAPPVTARPERATRRRRTRVLLAVVPVVVVAGGTTLAIQHLPYASAPQARAGTSPSTPVTAPAGPTAPAAAAGTAGTGPSGTASPAQPPAQDPGQAGTGGPPAAAAGGAGGGQGGGVGGGGTGTGPLPGGGTQPGPGSAGNSGNPANAGGSGGTRPSNGGTSTAPTTPAPPAPPASGTYRFRNGNNGKCVTQVFGASDYGDCADASARWTVRSRPDGSFELVNQQGGGCLYANMLGQAVFVGDCSQGTARLWRTGAGGSLRNDFSGGCLDLGMSGGLVTNTCGGQASQRWTKSA
ncbi:serine/threonine protein kinase [Streptomyces spororaveus]|uniref:serine/threonine-protein kinase n=1 Tax=Streptomyces spororaveus TaxID=284039 RepID=UPI002079D53B|nr:serine/threonine protein kinase [Streptomyces spororaveus]MCM9077058.1 serine/threonine protein kinase [Streptomyces spororaveus]